jgi:hypothetical protein
MVNMKTIFLLIATIVGWNAWAANLKLTAKTYYIHLEGTASGLPQEDVLKKFHDVFLDPLGPSGRSTYNSYATQVQGPKNYFVFNYIFEAMNDSQIQKIEQYVSDREGMTVFGNKVTFRTVTQIKETLSLLIGDYDGTQDDAFVLKYNYPRNFSFADFSQWLSFSNEFGYALLGSHDKFKTYMESYTKSMPEKPSITALFARHNMMALDSDISVILENGEVITQDFKNTPFSLFRFIRSCYLPQYENGKCY